MQAPQNRWKWWLGPIAVFAVACGGIGDNDFREDADTDGGVPDSADDSASDSASLPDVAYWGMGGALVLVEGGVDISTSAIELHLQGVDSCAIPATIVEAGEPTFSEVDGAVGWSLTVEATPIQGCPWLGPTQLVVVFGPTDAALTPAADRGGLSAPTSFGLYVGPTGTEPALVGIAGTPANLSGAEKAEVVSPLPDATYTLHTLHGLPLE